MAIKKFYSLFHITFTARFKYFPVLGLWTHFSGRFRYLDTHESRCLSKSLFDHLEQ